MESINSEPVYKQRKKTCFSEIERSKLDENVFSKPRKDNDLMFVNNIENTSSETTVNERNIQCEINPFSPTAKNVPPFGTLFRLKMRIFFQIIFPLASNLTSRIKDLRLIALLQNISFNFEIFTNLLALVVNAISQNLSGVQVSQRLEVFFNLMKFPRRRVILNSVNTEIEIKNSEFPVTYSPIIREPKGSLVALYQDNRAASVTGRDAHKCCTLNILAEPPEGQPICADIIFIHGLHGSLVNTWKQGLWQKERNPIKFQRPPGPPVRPPKRPKHSRFVLKSPQKSKRMRFSSSSEFSRISNTGIFSSTDEEENRYTENDDMTSLLKCNISDFNLQDNDHQEMLNADIENFIAQTKSDLGCENENEQANDDYSKCWPGDWLPLDCPGVRVIALNYTTDQYLWRPIWKKKEPRSSIVQRAKEMSKLLITHGVGNKHPIVWVGHSKGGLFVKQIIVNAWESDQLDFNNLWRSSRGCFFYSVPHRGSHLASIKAPFLARSIELIEIERNSKYLQDLHRRFVALYHLGHLKIEIFSFVEMALTLMSVLYLRIVGVDSADPGIGEVCGLRLDHREICKPRGRDCILYQELIKMIKKIS